jgi:hypothetical protein
VPARYCSGGQAAPERWSAALIQSISISEFAAGAAGGDQDDPASEHVRVKMREASVSAWHPLTMRSLPALALMSACLVVACGGGGRGAGAAIGHNSGVIGRVRIAPTCPVARVPADPGCKPRPYAARIRAYRRLSGRLVARTRAGSDGRFKLRLPAARYTIVASNPSGAGFPRPGRRVVTVHRHRFARVNIQLDSGIR